MSTGVASTQRFTRRHPCPVCGGGDDLPRGKGRRCVGYLSSNGEYAYCTREEHAGPLPLEHTDPPTFRHRLSGECRCGASHGLPADVSANGRGELVESYDYVDAEGTLRFQVCRFEPKRFLQRRPDGAGGWIWNLEGVERVLYRLRDVLEAVGAGVPIHVCEGEKDVHAAEVLGLIATTNPGGAGKWRETYSEVLRGAEVVVIADLDADQSKRPGLRHAREVVRSLEGKAASVAVLGPRAGNDLRDHLESGLAFEELEPLSPDWIDEQLGKAALDWMDEPFGPAGAAPAAPAARTAPAGRPGERVRLTTIGDVAMRRITYLEEGLIPERMLTGVVAPGGTMKGLFGIYQSGRLAGRGERTLFVCSEDALDCIVRPRFEAAGCDAMLATQVDVETETGTRELRLPSDLALLQEAVERVRPALVIIDPFSNHIDPGLQMFKNEDMRRALQPLIVLARETGIAIIVVFHTGKDRSKGALGTVAFEDACRFVLTAGKDDEDEDVRHIEATKSNVGRVGYGRKFRIVEVPLEIEGETVGVAKLVDEGPSSKSVHELLARRGTPGPDPTQREGAKAVLIEVLTAAEGRALNAKEVKRQVAEQAKVSPATVWRAFTELKEAGEVGASANRDEYGSITEWQWFAKTSLLVGRGDA